MLQYFDILVMEEELCGLGCSLFRSSSCTDVEAAKIYRLGPSQRLPNIRSQGIPLVRKPTLWPSLLFMILSQDTEHILDFSRCISFFFVIL